MSTFSKLFDENSFYPSFLEDLKKCKDEVIIESPYLTIPRVRAIKPILEKLAAKGVEIYIITRYPQEHDEFMAEQSEAVIRYFENLDVRVLLCKGHRRKLAMIDETILWKGSLNILSQTHSREFMRRIEDREATQEMFKFLNYNKVKFFRKEVGLL